MKRFILFFGVLLLSSNLFSQTGSSYYLPLKVGNFTKLKCDNPNGGWASRITLITIEGTDMINGVLHYRERGVEYTPDLLESHVFRVMWLRTDNAGNLILGAVSPTGSSNPDSAIVVNHLLFPNEYLTAGYSRRFTFQDYVNLDSILSVSETVTVPTGTYYNCIKYRTSHFDFDGKEIFREIQYYAPNVGYIYNSRELPETETHVDQLIESNIITGIVDQDIIPNQYLLNQNFPNPFNPSTKISFSIPERGFVSLKVFDLMGNEIAVLVSKELMPGTHSLEWKADGYPSGVYFYRLESGNFHETKKLILLK